MEPNLKNVPGLPAIPAGMQVPDLSKLAQTFDPSQLPDGIRVEFTLIDFHLFLDALTDGTQRVRFEFFTPMLPFIKFSIPWGKENLEDLLVKFNRALELLNEAEIGFQETEPPTAA
jgi:hypothetical protein